MSGLLIDHQCPQCGAPAVLEETDRLFSCPYCRVKSYLLQKGHFRYSLPHRAPEDAAVFYIPYWRMRGMMYWVQPGGIDSRVVDHSQPAVAGSSFPLSLGLRSQAMRLQFAGEGGEGRFIRPNVTRNMAETAFKGNFGATLVPPPCDQAFIGETLSLIYAPFYVRQGLTDAVLNRQVRPEIPDFSGLSEDEGRWPVLFVPTLCPNCGWDMDAERDALALPCRRCGSLWRAGEHGLKRMKAAHLPADEARPVFLPFWRVSVTVSGLILYSFADFARLANLPRVIRPEWHFQPFAFWIPAFKIQPRAFFRLGSAMTLAQPEEDPVPEVPEGSLHPVTLPLSEAVETVRVLMADLFKPKHVILPRLARMTVTPVRGMLIFVPFRDGPHDLTHGRFPIGVHKNTLIMGKHI